MDNTNVCRCKGFGCEVRIARGMTPFCQMPTPVSTPEPNVYGSYREALEQANGRHVEACGGYAMGNPRLFRVVK
jgi:hypothetical protein